MQLVLNKYSYNPHIRTQHEVKSMEVVLQILIAVAIVVLSVTAFVAVTRLFTINETLKQIHNELLLARQERQFVKADEGGRRCRGHHSDTNALTFPQVIWRVQSYKISVPTLRNFH